MKKPHFRFAPAIPQHRNLFYPVAPAVSSDKDFSVPEPVASAYFVKQLHKRLSPKRFETALVVFNFRA
jgi:hypothetical protein